MNEEDDGETDTDYRSHERLMEDRECMIRTIMRKYRKWGNTRMALKDYNTIVETFDHHVNELEEVKKTLPAKNTNSNDNLLNLLERINSRLDKLEAAPK